MAKLSQAFFSSFTAFLFSSRVSFRERIGCILILFLEGITILQKALHKWECRCPSEIMELLDTGKFRVRAGMRNILIPQIFEEYFLAKILRIEIELEEHVALILLNSILSLFWKITSQVRGFCFSGRLFSFDFDFDKLYVVHPKISQRQKEKVALS